MVVPPPIPSTFTGTLLPVFVPSPSWPNLLFPQHCTPPSGVIAQVCAMPAAMACVSPPVTGTKPVNATDGRTGVDTVVGVRGVLVGMVTGVLVGVVTGVLVGA